MSETTRQAYDGLFGLLVDLIGLGWTLRLCQDFGGTEVYFPKRLADDHPVVISIGHEAARRVAEYAGGDGGGATLEIPRGVSFNNHKRNAQIFEDLQSGDSKKVIARRYGLTTRWVRYLCNSKQDDRQKNLF